MSDPVDPGRWSGKASPTHVVAHLSDTHVIADGSLLGGHVDTVAGLHATLESLRATETQIDAVVVSGDLVDRGDLDSYALFGSILRSACTDLGAQLIVTGGNHDDRDALAQLLFPTATDAPTDASNTAPNGAPARQPGDPSDRVHDVQGLRIITMDSALPGSHAGGFSDAQYRWLQRVLEQPAPHGSMLVMHHAPIPYRSPIMQLLDFDEPERLQAALEGSDVRAILSGHLHVTTSATLGSVPVYVAGGRELRRRRRQPPAVVARDRCVPVLEPAARPRPDDRQHGGPRPGARGMAGHLRAGRAGARWAARPGTQTTLLDQAVPALSASAGRSRADRPGLLQ